MSRLASVLKLFGLDPAKGVRTVLALPAFLRSRRAFRELAKSSQGARFAEGKLYPVLDDLNAAAGVATGHYFHQDIFVARRIFEHGPRRHIDVASRVDGFVAHVAVFRQIDVVDIRKLETSARNIRFMQADLMDPVTLLEIGTADSVSCLHALEHFGLGRYGDPLDYHGYRKGLHNLCSLVEPGGRLYVSVPIGPQRVEFNAHRVFACKTIIEAMPAGFTLQNISHVDDAGDLNEGNGPDDARMSENFSCHFGCGIFEYIRNAD